MDEFNVGDRVKVEFEGKIVNINSTYFRVSIDDGVYIWLSRHQDITVTRTKPPLPTTEGSLIKAGAYGYFVLTTDFDGNPSWGNSDYAFEPYAILHFDYEVVYDAGAQQ